MHVIYVCIRCVDMLHIHACMNVYICVYIHVYTIVISRVQYAPCFVTQDDYT